MPAPSAGGSQQLPPEVVPPIDTSTCILDAEDRCIYTNLPLPDPSDHCRKGTEAFSAEAWGCRALGYRGFSKTTSLMGFDLGDVEP